MKTGSLSPMSSSTADFPPEIPALVTSVRPAWLPFEEPAAGNDEIRNNNTSCSGRQVSGKGMGTCRAVLCPAFLSVMFHCAVQREPRAPPGKACARPLGACGRQAHPKCPGHGDRLDASGLHQTTRELQCCPRDSSLLPDKRIIQKRSLFIKEVFSLKI